MNMRVGVAALGFVAVCSWVGAAADESSPSLFQFPRNGQSVRPDRPRGSLRDGTYAHSHRSLMNDFIPRDRNFNGPDGRGNWIFVRDNQAIARQVSEGKRREAIRVFRAALRDALAEQTEIDETFLSFAPFQHENRRIPESSSSSGSWEDRVRFRVGVSHLSPKVEMRCDLGGSALGLSVSALGRVNVELAPAGNKTGHLQAGFDPADGRYDVGYRLTF